MQFDSLKPLLVLGEGRSGTTLLMQLLGTSDRIAFDRNPPFETRYLMYFLHWSLLLNQQPDAEWGILQNAFPPGGPVGAFPFNGSEFWNGEKLWPRCFGAAWECFSRDVSAKLGTSPVYYSEKISHWAIAYLQKVIPYKIVVLVRDPRDIFLSVSAFDKRRGFPGFARRMDDDDWAYARRFVGLQKERFPIMRDEAASGSGILVKYENLALDLKSEARRLSDWLDIALDPEAVKAQAATFAKHMTSESLQSSVERWRREMSPDFNDYFRSELCDQMRHFGYEA